MPELPDVTIYVERLQALLTGRELHALRILNPFVLRSVEPAPSHLAGARFSGARRLGKRIALQFGDDMFVVIHLMIAGRLRWREPGKKLPGKLALAAFDFEHGSPAAHRCTSPAAKLPWTSTTAGGSSHLNRLGTSSPARCAGRITHSSARSPTRACSAASATHTRTRYFIARGFHRSR
jgi:formamidopyrimidine-DNA glycosylase